MAKEGNFIVETSLDRRLQAIAEKSLKTHILNQGPRYRYSQGALVTLNSQTGEILALVGGVDYQKSQFNRAIQAKPCVFIGPRPVGAKHSDNNLSVKR
ncbi:Multimodular transpeptidase-transglycosylase [Microcystis aeruginosa NIES-98]|nr:Multimodular transpeptidase-transglycosylase [Microcystis aeruginosa NIES-98]